MRAFKCIRNGALEIPELKIEDSKKVWLGMVAILPYTTAHALLKKNPKQGRRNVYGHSRLVQKIFLGNHIRNTTRDDKFCIDILISPEKVLKSGQSWKTLLRHCRWRWLLDLDQSTEKGCEIICSYCFDESFYIFEIFRR